MPGSRWGMLLHISRGSRSTPFTRLTRFGMVRKRRRILAYFDCRLAKPAATSMFEAELPHHSAALCLVLPPEPDPLAERCYPRVFASASHPCRLKRCWADGTIFKARRGPEWYCIIALVMNDLGVDERDAVRAAAKTRVAMLRMVLVSLAHGRHEELCQSGTTSRTLGPRSEYGTRRN